MNKYDLDLNSILEMSYDDYVELLLKKYGKVLGDYFIDDVSFKINKSNIRSNEGLVIHHIDEDKMCDLSRLKSTKKAKTYFKYQKAERLVYCNHVEHMILHMKIVEKELSKPFEERNKQEQVGIGGFEIILRETNTILLYAYYHKDIKQCSEWKKVCAEELKGWWTTVFLRVIEYFVENVEKRSDFIDWYGAEADLKKRLKMTHQIYKSKDRLFNQAISKKYPNKITTKSKLNVSVEDGRMHVKYEPSGIEVCEMIETVIETVTNDINDIRAPQKNDLLSIDVTLKPKKG